MKEDVFDLEGLEELMLRKSFAELSEEERRMVSRHIASESEYNDLRDTLVNVRQTLQEEKIVLRPRVDMKEALLKRFEEVHGEGGGTTRMDNRPKRLHIPVFYRYASVAAVLLVAFLVVFNQFGGLQKPKTKDVAMLKENQQPSAPPADSFALNEDELSPNTNSSFLTAEDNKTVGPPLSTGDAMVQPEATTEETGTLSPGGENPAYFSSSREPNEGVMVDKVVTSEYKDMSLAKEEKKDDGTRSNAFENYGGYYTESQKLKNTSKTEELNTTAPSSSNLGLSNTSVQGNTSYDDWKDNSSLNTSKPLKDKNANLKAEIRRSLIYSDL